MGRYAHVISFLLAFLVCLTGWILNVVALVNAGAITGLTIARAIGVLFPPLGITLGLFI